MERSIRLIPEQAHTCYDKQPYIGITYIPNGPGARKGGLLETKRRPQ
jgi:hypothetical protein